MIARIRSDIFVSALCRRVFADGNFAAVEHRGAEAAGAIAIRQTRRDGTEDLFMPAPQSLMEEDGTRLFERRLSASDAPTVSERLQRELRFDPDLWVVALEVETVDGLFDIAE